ncbi:hypothetical protein OE517_31555 [Pseudomonas aeruginosa]|uniref:hypothetical protein n=1 Tax=Pseudomonas aeruginosa TaxID=287 RepID=UPI00156AEBA3|nr:hypothetical protein [Pseudomonas aeruginosa]MCU8859526.1 hypothetical protein [Pseudomonas aeruginosa]MCU8941846.1 hypothetical protein [Pseudomonas aeruginosa]NRR81222.1 hypothetical protein [Pseudomonas aeruginosa]
MTHAMFKQIDLTAKLGQDGSSLQAMNALRVIRETVAKHLAGAEGAEEHPLERAVLALRTIAEFPCPEQDNMPAANMRQIALAALSGAGASSEPGNPGGEPVSGPGNAGEQTHPAPGLARDRDPLTRAPHAERPEFDESEREDMARTAFETAMTNGISLDSFTFLSNSLAERYERIVGALKAELQSQRERNTELIFKLGSATNGWGRCEEERDAALARVAELEAKLAELERQEPVSTEHLPMHIAYARAKREVFLGSCQEDVFRFALIDLLQEFPLYAAPVAQAQQLHDLDKQCRDDVARALGLRPSQERGFAWSYLLASIKSCVKAQHSVPEGWMLVPVEPTPEMLDARRDSEDGMDGYLVEDTEYYFPGRDAVRAFLARVYRGLIAAAPAPGGER